MAFTIELRDNGVKGFILPRSEVSQFKCSIDINTNHSIIIFIII